MLKLSITDILELDRVPLPFHGNPAQYGLSIDPQGVTIGSRREAICL
jgi:hypothetical protein